MMQLREVIAQVSRAQGPLARLLSDGWRGALDAPAARSLMFSGARKSAGSAGVAANTVPLKFPFQEIQLFTVGSTFVFAGSVGIVCVSVNRRWPRFERYFWNLR